MNTNIKKILGGILAIIILGVLIFLNYDSSSIISTTSSTTPTVKVDDADGDSSQIKQELPGQDLPLSNAPKDVAWAVFQKYLGYNKSQNLEGVKSTVYKVASVCEDPKTTIDCKARMNLAYQYGSLLDKKDFVNVWNDENQIILATNFKTVEDSDVIGRNRAIIFFVNEESGLKMLSFSPFKGGIISKGEASKEEIDDRILRFTEDSDEDGIADYDEECLSVKEGEICTKTNPKVRDTDGDGLWDGVEALMK